MIKKTFITSVKLISIAFILYTFVIFKLGIINRISSVEWDFYQSYTRSIIEDHDLNILNNIPISAAWIASTTFNYPEMHDHGAPVMWSPIISFFNAFSINQIVVSPELKFPKDSALYFLLNWLLFIIGFILLVKISPLIFNTPLNSWGLFFTFWGTGLYYYTLIEYMGTETTLFFYSVLLFGYCCQIQKNDSLYFYFSLGALFAFGRIIKIHFFTYLIPLCYFYFVKNNPKNFKSNFKFFSAFSTGFLLLIIPLEYNNFLKFGFLNFGQGYLNEFSFESFFKIDDNLITYFGPLGFFYATPVFFFSFSLFIWGIYKWITGIRICLMEKVGLLLYSSVFLKLLALQFVPTPGLCEFGNRNFIIDSMAHILLFSTLFNDVKNKRLIKISLITLFMAGCLWTMINYFWQNEVATWKPDQRMAHYIWSQDLIFQQIHLHYLRAKDSFAYLFENFYSNIQLFYLCIFCSILLLNLRLVTDWLLQKKNILYVSAGIIILYLSVTLSNGLNNSRNSFILSQDKKFSKVSIGNGPHIFTYDNVATDLIPTMELDKFLGNRKSFEYKKRWFLDFLKSAESELIVDNTNFRQSLQQGRLPKIGVTDQEGEQQVLSFDLPDRFKRK